jgi:hypothetical protein
MNIGNLLAAGQLIQTIEFRIFGIINRTDENLKLEIKSKGSQLWEYIEFLRTERDIEVLKNRMQLSDYLVGLKNSTCIGNLEIIWYLRTFLENNLEASLLDKREVSENETIYIVKGRLGVNEFDLEVACCHELKVEEAARMVREGYTLEDDPGECITVFTPGGGVYKYMSGVCSCGHYNCNHRKLIQVYHNNKLEFLSAKVAKITS